MKRSIWIMLAGILPAYPIFAGVPVINELLAKNVATVTDSEGEFDDWLELYNGGNTAVSLAGWSLTNDFTRPRKWSFPDVSIPVNGRLIVWMDNDIDQAGLHANFKLTASGEVVYLFDPGGNIADRVVLSVQVPDVSYGRYPDGSGWFRRMFPTFNAANRGDPTGISDSSDIVFNESVIHTIDLHFYDADWQNLLRRNFEVLGKTYMPVRLTFDSNQVLDSVGVRYKGNSSYTLSRNTPKKPFKFYFSKYIEHQTLHGLEKINLSNCISDPTFMREPIAYSIARRYMPAPRTAFVNLSVDGQLIGFYVIVEQIDRNFLKDYFEDNSFSLYKARNNGAFLEYRGGNKSDYVEEYSYKSGGDGDNWSDIIELLDLMNNTPRAEFSDIMAEHLNLNGVARLMAFNMVLSNFDSYTGSGRNFYLYNNRFDGRFVVIPWDLNESFGVFRNNWNVITQDIDYISNLSRRPLIRRVLECDSLKRLYWEYIDEMVNNTANYDSIETTVNRLKPLIENSVRADNNKLYDYRLFEENLTNEVSIELGRTVPGLLSFSRSRNANLREQLAQNRVYPGDTDNNGVVNALDILPIAVYLLEQGPPRGAVTYAWSPQRGQLWENLPATYADANGDGLVDEKDVVGIGVNWGNRHESGGEAYVINPDNFPMSPHIERQLRTLYRTLEGETPAIIAMRKLIESLIGFTDNIPRTSNLFQNYPNPFNNSTIIPFKLATESVVSITIYNSCGQEVARPLNAKVYPPGRHVCLFPGSDLPNGVYICRFQTGRESGVMFMVLEK